MLILRLIRAFAASVPALGLAMLCCSNALAVSSDWPIAQLHHTAWTPRDGAPTSIVTLAQTEDGFLWLGTTSGLFRFDGVHFERFHAPAGAGPLPTSVRSLLASRSGGLWIGYAFGGISFLKDGKLTHYSANEGLGPGGVGSLGEDDAGSIWAVTSSGLFRFEHSRWTDVTSLVLPQAGRHVGWLSIDRQGTLWISAGGKLFYRPKGRLDPSAILLAANPDDAFSATFSAAVARPQAGLEVAAATSYRFASNDSLIDSAASRTRWMSQSGAGAVTIGGGLIDNAGAYWIVYSHINAVCRIRLTAAKSGRPAEQEAELECFGAKDGLTGQSARAVIQDAEGDIWVGTTGGLDRFREPTLVPVKLPTATEVGMSGAADGRVWLAATRADDYQPLVLTHDGISARRFSQPRILECLYRGSDGVVWGAAGQYLWKSTGDQWAPVDDQLPHARGSVNTCQAILSSPDGSLWISVRRLGVFHREHGGWQPVNVPDASNREPAVALAANSKGQIWMGLINNRIALVDGKSVRILTTADGLDTGTVLALDAHRGHTWVGGEHGLDRYDGSRFEPVLLSDGRAGFAVSGIDELANGDLWLNTTEGALQIPAQEVQRMSRDPGYRVHYRLFDSLEGMPGSPAGLAGLPSLIEATDGRLWFGTTNGVAWIDPTQLTTHNSRPPAVFIEEIASSGKRYPIAGPVTLPMWTSDLQIGYTAPSLAIPEHVAFRYRLDGVDRDWQLAGTRREAYYTNVPPGRHLFSVNAASVNGVWSDTSAQETIVIPAAFTQTRAFVALCLLACSAAIVVMFKVRMRQVKRRVRERLELQVAERTRLARDLHDTLLQTVQASKLAAEGALEQRDMSESTRSSVSRLFYWLERAEYEGRAALNALRSREAQAFASVPRDLAPGPPANAVSECSCGEVRAKTSTLELTQAIDAAGRTLMLSYPAAFRTSQQGMHTQLQRKLCTEIVLIVTEALQNAFRHAGAREVRVELHFSRWRLRARVRDDGQGFEAARALDSAKAGHWGIKGMRERAQRIHADLRIISTPGAGTLVELRILRLAAWLRGVSV